MKKIYNFYFNEKLPLTIFIFIIFIIGVCFGAFGIKTVDYGLKKDLYDYFNSFTYQYNEFTPENNLLVWNGFKDNFLSLLVISLSGFLVFTVPFIPFIIFVKGFVLGFSSAFFLTHYGFKGILVIFMIIFPQNIFLITAYVFSAVISISLSGKVIQYYRGNKRFIKRDIEETIMNILLWSIVIVCGVLVEIYLIPFLMKFAFKYLI